MKVSYDKTTDTLQMIFADRPVHESDEVRAGVVVDFDAQGHVVGLEILDASRSVTSPATVELIAA